MAVADKYSIRDLKKDFPDDASCVEAIFDALHTRECSCGGTYRPVKGRRQFQCSKCRFQIAPTSGTIFHKSDTPLNLWFHAIFVFSNAKSGISAKELERQIGVTYKTAWRMLTLIRKALGDDGDKLNGDVEMDGSYFGGRVKSGKGNARQSEAVRAKSPVIGAVQRGGDVRAKVMPDFTAASHGKFLNENIQKEGTRLMTDRTRVLEKVAEGYTHETVNHHLQEYTRGDIHINSLESFWSHAKRSIKGTHKVISKKYLQSYLDGFVWHYNNRHNDRERFVSLLGVLLRVAG